MPSIDQRLTKLEQAKRPVGDLSIPVAILDGTSQEVVEKITAIEDEHTLVITFTPHIGETMNEARGREGMKPMDVPGWDMPRAAV